MEQAWSFHTLCPLLPGDNSCNCRSAVRQDQLSRRVCDTDQPSLGAFWVLSIFLSYWMGVGEVRMSLVQRDRSSWRYHNGHAIFGRQIANPQQCCKPTT